VQLDRQLVAQRGFDAMDMRQPAGSLTASQVEQEMQVGGQKWTHLIQFHYGLSHRKSLHQTTQHRTRHNTPLY
jgi:hypothetical protein